ncbi:DNA annealing helicase and endonuclease ZRANB3 [Sorex fumeus]|uniref:DNA annealing helicase and endonuclease ZRANB3 n=1 Tax=Sorex fumeus TaxID=62283 RepID=UPI0024AD15EA|nr:DNA annealing helicase and endonuclease ZRANB3 [Sorex fumeus]
MSAVRSIKKSRAPLSSCLTSDSHSQLEFLPDKLRAKLLPFQKDGITFALERNGRCMVADEMGLGKTIQAIAITYFYKEEWPLLIVVPSSLRYPWTEEIEKWIPELGPEEINVIQNKNDVWRISTSKVTVLGYGLLTTDAETLIDVLNNQNFKVVIVDESHYMKSRNATRSKILLPLVQKAKRAILLTGTPALGRPEELFMQIEALFPQKFGKWTDYAKRYCNAHVRYFGKRSQWDCRGASNLNELHQLLSDIMIRRLKTEVLTQLPPKIRQRIPFDVPAAAAKELNASFEEWEKLMRAPSSAAETIMGLITRMFKQTAIAKAGAVKDYIKMMLQNESLKFLVFAHHLSMLQACTEAVVENKTRYIRIDGSVPSSERIHLVNQFQKDPDTRVAILSIQAAGQGLTFTAATHVVFAELYWDPGHIRQAEDRAHRIGQCSSVNIHYLIANGTLDTLMWGMLNRKTQVTGRTLNGRKEQMQAQEDDKEKWDFLQFAEAWTPSESSEEFRNEILFTHFEKDKQHDIRSFFSPKPKKGQLVTSCSESSISQEENTGAPADPGTTSTRDFVDSESNLEPEAKRLKSDQHCRPSAGKPSRPKQDKGPLLPQDQEAEAQTAALPLPKMGWQCGFCTYINNSLLPYCEMCENPQGSTDSCNHTQEKKKSKVDDSKNDTSEKVQPHSDCEKRALPQSEPEPLPESKEETPTTPEPGDGLTPEPSANESKSSEALPVYDTLMFCASKNTDRIHLYTKDGKQMNCNFIPLDIKLDLWEDLPASFQLKQNRSLILRFVREWNSLTAMKQKVIRKSGQLFCSPFLAWEAITKPQTKPHSTKRYITKEDVAVASMDKVKKDGGYVRLITKDSRSQDPSTKECLEDGACVPFLSPCAAQADLTVTPPSKGYLQAVDNEGNPLCLRCQQPTCQTKQDCKVNPWDSQFCSLQCQEEFWIRSNNSYLRAKVFEIEHGVCQLCHLNAQELFLRMKDAPKSQRKNLLDITWISKLPLEQLNEMIRNPGEGQFWQVDHIKPVFGGGGQCSLDNLQTLCTICHRERTAKQAKERSQMRRLAPKHGSDITRFLVKK